MVRMGEMMVVVRAQDYASRTLHKVSGELAGLSRAQALANKQMIMGAKQARLAQKIDLSKNHLTNLRTIKESIAAEKRYQDLYKRRNALRRMVSTGRNEFGQYMSKADLNTAVKGHQALTRELRKLGIEMGHMDDAISRMPTKYGRMALAARSTAAGMADLNEAYRAGRISAGELAVQERLLMQEHEMLQKSIQRMGPEKLHRIGAAMSGLGRTMQLFGAVGTIGFGLAANSFAKFSASAATAGTQMRDLNAPMAQATARSQELQDAILEMAMVFPNSAQDMTDSAYEIFSSMNLMHNGVMDVQAGLQLLATANKAAVAGQVDLSEATNAMIVALNIFDPQLKDVKGTMDEVFNIVRFGKIHLDDLSHVFTQFASAAKSGGMSLKQIGAAFATLTLFQDPGKASAGLGRLIELLRTPQFKEGLKNLVDVDIISPDTGKMKPLLTIMQQIVKARPELAASRKAAIDFFIELTKASGKTKVGVQGTVQARRAFETFATHMETFAETTNHVANNYDEMNKAFQSRMADPGVQWELFLHRMKALALVIGKAVLPVFIRLGNWIVGIVKFIKNLNDGTSGTIFRLAAWAAVGTLLAGVLLSVSGGMVQLAATIALVTIASEGASVAFIAMRMALIATGIGAVVVGLGLAAVMVIRHWNAVRAFFMAFGQELKANWDGVMKYMAGVTLKGVAAILNPLYQLQKRIPLVGRFMKFAGPLNMAAAGMEAAGDKLMASAEDQNLFWARYRYLVKKYGKDSKKSIDWLKDFKRIAGDFDGRMLSEEYQKWANSVADSTGKATQKAKDHAAAVKQATENMQNTIKTATTNLVNLYEQMQTANRTALGGLFQGPVMQGVLGGVFKNINDSLRQFGVQIPVPFKILKQDLEQSLTYFKRWRQGINTLLKRGVPHEMLQELQAMGPEGIPIIEGLLAAPKGQFRGIINMYKQGQKLTDKATQEDMKRKLAYWNKFGKDAAWQMIMGIITNPKNAKIAKMYEEYVKTTYGAILKKAFQDDVAEYMANALAMAQAAAEQSNIFKNAPNLFAPGGTPNKSTAAFVTPQQVQATRNLMLSRKGAAGVAGKWAVDPRSPGGSTITGPEDRAILQLQQEQWAAQRKWMRQRKALAAQKSSIRGQLVAQGAGSNPAGALYTISYGGDTVTIHADGATPAAVQRAIAKLAFKKKHKHKKGTTVKP